MPFARPAFAAIIIHAIMGFAGLTTSSAFTLDGNPGTQLFEIRLAASSLPIYTDALASGWENWSWDTTVSFNNPTPVQSGSAALATRYDKAWAGLYLHTNNLIDAANYDELHFWLHGGPTGGQKFRVVAVDANLNAAGEGVSVTAQANTWLQVSIPLNLLGNPANISGFWWQEWSGKAQPTFYLDEITLIHSGATPVPTPTPSHGPTLQVDAAAGQHPISPYIYGMNFADEALARELRLPVRRWGGNDTTRYNWQTDTSNQASDWFFENIPKDNANPGLLPNGSSSDRFVEQDRRTGTRTILTMPMIGWTAKSRAFACGFRVSKYGAQQRVDSWYPDCGNGVYPNGSLITGNDPADTSIPIDPSFVQAWISHLIARYGAATQGGVAFYNLDNEPDIWFETHRDVFPLALTYGQFRDRTYQYAAAIKSADPSAQTLGPVVHGWTYYFHSPRDGQYGLWATRPDRMAHGDIPFVEWYLQQMRAYEQEHGTRILDYLDLHYYPQASGVALAPAGTSGTQALRLRSTRSLWDPTYLDESWISTTEPGGIAVRLIPRMREWVNAHYPGTKLAISEYNWGALDHINGALAQADVLGIFGREQLDLATLWDPPQAGQPGAYAFRMYRNYDGTGSAFGETSVNAASTDQGQLAIYAASRDRDLALTLMVINKTPGDLTSHVSLSGFNPADSAQVYRYSASSLNTIEHQPDQPVSRTGFDASFPGTSIMLLVLLPSRLPACIADLDANGIVDLADIQLAAIWWNRTGFPKKIDINGNGAVGIDDVMAVAVQWEQRCD